MTAQVRAILWAQWRSLLNYYPKSNKAGLAFGVVLSSLWYGAWLTLAIFLANVFSAADNAGVAAAVLPSGLLFVFLYWQVVPVLLASTGVSLSTRKIQVYPVASSQLFFIELLLRISTTAEMALVLTGLAVGLLINPSLPRWSAGGIVLFAMFNLCLSAGTRELMVRVFERKRVREVAVLLLVMVGALPQLIIALGYQERLAVLLRSSGLPVWPWSVTAAIARGRPSAVSVTVLVAWTAAAYLFGRWQFERTLRFDADESNATEARTAPGRRSGVWVGLARWPALLFPDPLAALVEKEIRSLSRAPRFRLVFVMGFTFGLVIWLPMAVGRGKTQLFGSDYLTFICVYALLLLGDVCFWNVFGFDRVAAQVYWAMPVPFSTVLASKNISAFFFVLLETTMITLMCTVLRMPVTATRVAEAYTVTLTAAVYLVSLGNLTSTANARAINPSKAMRSGAPGRLQATMLLLYPVAAGPVLLAYGARYAFESQAAFFLVLGISASMGAAVYWVSLESAIGAAERNKERLLTALGQGEGVLQG